ncbi:MAG: DUF2341 domain-containing protein [Candidatus Omnitrophica bacterium]|nr:DUF2341 domain-containing protein [Candidatus Omnitrophota bacterium]
MYTKKIQLILILIATLSFFSYAYAEVATLIGPLTWRLDNSGAYSFPKPLNGAYAPSDFVATPGQINSITANWEAEGEIAFEVSADNGLHYYPVTNGVPLKSGFVSGNRLRWRANALSGDAKLLSVKISYTDSSRVLGSFGHPDLSGFKYRKAMLIKNPGNQDLYNYQIKLNIGENPSVKGADLNCSGHIQADFKDIRFTASDAETLLPHYLESLAGLSPKRTAVVWVKVPQIPKSGVIIYLYYGKAQAEDLSDPEKTFDFFDDFKGQALNQEKWNVYPEQQGSYSVGNGKIRLDAAEIVTKDFKFKEGVVEYLCELGTGFENSLSIRQTNIKSYDNPYWSAYSSVYKGAEHCIAVDNIVKANDADAKPAATGEQYNYSLSLEAGKIVFERMDASFKELGASISYQITPEPKAGYLSLRSGGDGSGKNNMYFGPIRVRKASAVIPVIESMGGEDKVSLPVFLNTELSGQGSIILKAGALSGYYLSSDIASTVDVNIIIPSWQIMPADKTTLSVGFSTDKGLNYKQPCEKGKYYYSSKGDFASGTSLKLRVDFSRLNSKEESRGLSQLSLDWRPGKVNVITPNSSEDWGAGTKKKITWSALDYELTYPFDIAYSVDKGKTYTDIVTNTENDGVYFWTVPNELSKTVKIKISNSLDKTIYDTSDAFFSIVSGGLEAIEEAALAAEEEALKEEAEKTEEPKKRPETKLYDILIKIGDNVAPNPEVDKRASYKEGDIVMIKPAGYVWGAEERSKFLIVQAYLTPKQAEELIAPKTVNGRLLSRRQYKIDLRKQGIRKFWGALEKPKSVMDTTVVETKSGVSIGKAETK